jgi:hypothetical protein
MSMLTMVRRSHKCPCFSGCHAPDGQSRAYALLPRSLQLQQTRSLQTNVHLPQRHKAGQQLLPVLSLLLADLPRQPSRCMSRSRHSRSRSHSRQLLASSAVQHMPRGLWLCCCRRCCSFTSGRLQRLRPCNLAAPALPARTALPPSAMQRLGKPRSMRSSRCSPLHQRQRRRCPLLSASGGAGRHWLLPSGHQPAHQPLMLHQDSLPQLLRMSRCSRQPCSCAAAMQQIHGNRLVQLPVCPALHHWQQSWHPVSKPQQMLRSQLAQ